MSRIVIVAEHVEFRLELKKGQTEADEEEKAEYEEAEENLVPSF